jgi:death-on-curing protein
VTIWLWIEPEVALAVHERLVLHHGGAEGVRDTGLLLSALARPQQLAAYGEGPDVTDLAAAYSHGIVKNHPFVDGNERTGFVVGVLFLELNGVRFIASEAAATRAVLDLAAGTVDDKGYTAFLKENVERG